MPLTPITSTSHPGAASDDRCVGTCQCPDSQFTMIFPFSVMSHPELSANKLDSVVPHRTSSLGMWQLLLVLYVFTHHRRGLISRNSACAALRRGKCFLRILSGRRSVVHGLSSWNLGFVWGQLKPIQVPKEEGMESRRLMTNTKQMEHPPGVPEPIHWMGPK